MPPSPLLSLHTHNNNNNSPPPSSSLALSISSHQQKMSDFGASISLSRDLSDSSSSDQPPLSPTPLSSGGALLTNNTVVDDDDEDHHLHYPNNQQLMLTTPIQRKPRGRPPGSKNKPKPPVIITRDSEIAMKPVVLDIPAGCCIVDRIMTFGRRNHVGVSVMSASGSVVGVTLRQPAPHAPLVSLHGPFTILSLYGTFIGGAAAAAAQVGRGNSSVPGAANANPGLVYSCPSFGIVFTGTQGQVFGGLVAGRLVAASHVWVTVSTFAAPAFHIMGSEDSDQDRKDGGGSAGGGVGGNEGFGGGGSGGGGVSTGMSMGMGVYGGGGTPISVQMSRTHDVMQWATSHPPPAAY